MKKFFSKLELIKPAMGAALAALCGLMLWQMPLGKPWINASYDYLFRFGAHPVTNDVVLILMDNEAFNQFHQTRGKPWDRGLHAQLLNKLADDGCSLAVFDSFFQVEKGDANDHELAAAMRRQRNIILMAEQADVTHPDLIGAAPLMPAALFLEAARTNWGVSWLDPDTDWIVRRHWPFPSPGPYPDFAGMSARLAGARLSSEPQERWLRYYGQSAAWPEMSYGFALEKPKGYFHNKIVFIGTQPENPLLGSDPDKFNTPFTRWTDQSTGGVEIVMTQFLNLVNGDWLERTPAWLEFAVLLIMGVLSGLTYWWMEPLPATLSAAATMIVFSLMAVSCSYYKNYWFPWLIVAGGEIPCALAWSVALKIRWPKSAQPITPVSLPAIPGFKLFHPPIGKGAYGRVWLAQKAKGQWCALKIIYLKNFEGNQAPYEREFNGVSRYQPVSGKHPGLLRIDFLSEKLDGHFYYAMELGDSLMADWQREPEKYRPRDLASECSRFSNHRLPLRDCVQIAIALTEGLEYLHQHGLTHRDIKPQNVIFIDGRPKLADIGLIAEIRPEDQTKTLVGTPGYMPPPPEPPGTPQADIYALGMLLYVISTGHKAAFFPEISASLVDPEKQENFLPLNVVILNACQPDLAKRYKSMLEMRQALEALR